MSIHSSGSGSDTSSESHELVTSPTTGSKRKSVIDTRRAEQNRAAQRAFRQRKEIYLKTLENKVRDMEILKDRVERLEIENERLKYRVWELESSPNSNSNHATTTTTTTTVSNSSDIPLPPPPSSTSTTSYHGSRSSHGDDESESTQYSQHNHYQRTNNTVRTVDTNKPSSPISPMGTTANTTATVTHHILPPPSPSPSVFRPIPVAYWDKDTSKPAQQQHGSIQQQPYPSSNGDSGTSTPSEQGRVLDDLASILRTRHRPPIGQQHQPVKPEPMHI